MFTLVFTLVFTQTLNTCVNTCVHRAVGRVRILGQQHAPLQNAARLAKTGRVDKSGLPGTNPSHTKKLQKGQKGHLGPNNHPIEREKSIYLQKSFKRDKRDTWDQIIALKRERKSIYFILQITGASGLRSPHALQTEPRVPDNTVFFIKQP